MLLSLAFVCEEEHTPVPLEQWSRVNEADDTRASHIWMGKHAGGAGQSREPQGMGGDGITDLRVSLGRSLTVE